MFDQTDTSVMVNPNFDEANQPLFVPGLVLYWEVNRIAFIPNVTEWDEPYIL